MEEQNPNLKRINDLIDELLNVQKLIQITSQMLENTKDYKERKSLVDAIKQLKNLHSIKSRKLESVDVKNDYPIHNMWSRHSYENWANKTRLKTHPVYRRIIDGKKAFVDENDKECFRSISRERDAIRKYLQSFSPEYRNLMNKLIRIPTLKPMEDMCRIAVNVPAYNEGANIRKFLESYSLQKISFLSLMDFRMFEINIIINKPKGTPEDKDGISGIHDFMRKHPHLRVNFLSVEFEERASYGKRGVGLARKIITDLILLRSLNRMHQDGQLYIQSEDSDHHKINSKLLHDVITKLDKNPHLDAVYGIQDRDPSILMKNDLVFMERRLWYFIERIMQREHLRISGKLYQRRPDTAMHWNFNWHRVVTGGWNTAYTAESYALIGGYDPFRTQGEDMDIGQKISMMRGRYRNGSLIPCVDTIGRVYARISSSPRRFFFNTAREKSAYDGFEDIESDKSLKDMSDDELLKNIEDFSNISNKNLNRFQAVLSGLFGFLLSVEGYDDYNIKDERFNIARYIFDKAMFFLGFKKDDYEVKWVDYTDKKTNELKQAWGVQISSFQNFKRCLEDYKRLKKDKVYKNREIRSIHKMISKMDQGDTNVSLYWKRKGVLDEIKGILDNLNKIKAIDGAHKEIYERFSMISDYSRVLNQTSQNLEVIQNYLQDLIDKVQKGQSQSIKVSRKELIEKLKSFESVIKDHQDML